jgi:NAD(P)H-dependent FMN reductase
MPGGLTPPRIQVVVGTDREGRFSEKVAAWLMSRLTPRGDVDDELVDLRGYPLPFYDRAVPPAYGGREYPPGVARWAEKVDEADGYVVVTAEYNDGHPALLKNALDHTFPEFNRKPVAFVGYGNAGGSRAIRGARDGATAARGALPAGHHAAGPRRRRRRGRRAVLIARRPARDARSPTCCGGRRRCAARAGNLAPPVSGRRPTRHGLARHASENPRAPAALRAALLSGRCGSSTQVRATVASRAKQRSSPAALSAESSSGR